MKKLARNILESSKNKFHIYIYIKQVFTASKTEGPQEINVTFLIDPYTFLQVLDLGSYYIHIYYLIYCI